MATFEEFRFRIGSAASRFQFLEEGLKIHLDVCFEIVRRNIQGKLEFRYGDKDLRNKSLRPLINLFGKYSTNEDLIKRLKDLQDDRNYIAHQAYVMIAAPTKPQEMEHELERIKRIDAAVDEVVLMLMEETKKVMKMLTNSESP